jgi:hypothetical protein
LMVATTLQGSLTGLARAMVQRGMLPGREAEAFQFRFHDIVRSIVERPLQVKQFAAGTPECASEFPGIALNGLHIIDLEQTPQAALRSVALRPGLQPDCRRLPGPATSRHEQATEMASRMVNVRPETGHDEAEFDGSFTPCRAPCCRSHRQ